MTKLSVGIWREKLCNKHGQSGAKPRKMGKGYNDNDHSWRPCFCHKKYSTGTSHDKSEKVTKLGNENRGNDLTSNFQHFYQNPTINIKS